MKKIAFLLSIFIAFSCNEKIVIDGQNANNIEMINAFRVDSDVIEASKTYRNFMDVLTINVSFLASDKQDQFNKGFENVDNLNQLLSLCKDVSITEDNISKIRDTYSAYESTSINLFSKYPFRNLTIDEERMLKETIVTVINKNKGSFKNLRGVASDCTDICWSYLYVNLWSEHWMWMTSPHVGFIFSRSFRNDYRNFLACLRNYC